MEMFAPGGACLVPEGKGKQRVAGIDRYKLFAVYQIRNRARLDGGADGRLPKHGSRASIESIEISLVAATEKDIGCSGQNSGIGNVGHFEVPLLLSGCRIDCPDGAVPLFFRLEIRSTATRPGISGAATRVPLTGNELDLALYIKG